MALLAFTKAILKKLNFYNSIMNEGEKNCVRYVEISGVPYYKYDSGVIESIPKDKVEIYTKPPILSVDMSKLRNIVYFSTYPTVENICQCGSLYAKMCVEKGSVYTVCMACREVSYVNDI